MLHVRVVSPQDLTPRLVSALHAEPGVHNLVVLPGTARRPDGDAVQFDLLNESANPVLRQLRSLQLNTRGSVMIGEVNVALASPHNATETRRYARRERIPVWAVVEGTIRANATYPPSFYILLVIAGLIAAVGILTNSQILVIGAMVVGPEYYAIIAAALGCSKRDGPLIQESLTESRANALIGVFISITTLPAAASIGLSIAFSSWHDAAGSLYQLLLNVVILIVVGAIGLSTQRGLWHRLAGPDEGATGWRWD